MLGSRAWLRSKPLDEAALQDFLSKIIPFLDTPRLTALRRRPRVATNAQRFKKAI
jgi:hypothetical protein